MTNVWQSALLFQHAPTHKVRSLTKYSPSLVNYTGLHKALTSIPSHIWDELDRRQRARPYHPTSVANLTNALVAEWDKILQSGSNILWKAWNQKSGSCCSSILMLSNEMFNSLILCNVQVSTHAILAIFVFGSSGGLEPIEVSGEIAAPWDFLTNSVSKAKMLIKWIYIYRL